MVQVPSVAILEPAIQTTSLKAADHKATPSAFTIMYVLCVQSSANNQTTNPRLLKDKHGKDMEGMIGRYRIILHAYLLMGNHYDP